MMRRLLALLLFGVVGLAGFALAQEPPAKEEPPVRLKKKKPRGEDKPRVDPDKPDEKKDDKAEKKDDKKTEPRDPEPVTQQEEEKEVLQRVVKNVHNVGERLAKNDLGEATQQTQRDILKDLDSLIQRSENPPQGNEEQDDNQSGGGGGGGSKNKGARGAKMQSKRGGAKSGTRLGSSSQAMSKSSPGKGKLGGKDGKNGKGGGGGHKDNPQRNRAVDLHKHDVWGHLPQTLRPQMDAYSNAQPFMLKYDDLVKRYYQTIAEQGRRKGE
jgi:hypothetical protein